MPCKVIIFVYGIHFTWSVDVAETITIGSLFAQIMESHCGQFLICFSTIIIIIIILLGGGVDKK